MARLTPERWAQGGIGVLFLVLLRTLGEYFRLRAVLGPERGLAAFAPFLPALLLAVLGTAAAVLLFFARRFRTAVGAAAATVLVLLAYKLAAIP